MRKRYKLKKRSCAMCKPNKMHWAHRWNSKELAVIKDSEVEINNYMKTSCQKD